MIRPSAPQVYQCKITQLTGMTPQVTWGVFGGKSHGHPDIKREKTRTKSILFNVIFDVYTRLDNRERARASDLKQRRRNSLDEKHKNFIAAVRKWEMLAASKEQPARWKWAAVNKIKAKRNTRNRIFREQIINKGDLPLTYSYFILWREWQGSHNNSQKTWLNRWIHTKKR